MSCITIYTDASFCWQSKAGGWSCWIKSGPGESSLHSAIFKSPVPDNTAAEMMAICNSLSVAKKLIKPSHKMIVVVTDSLAAIEYIELARKHKTLPYRTTKKGNKSPRQRNPLLFSLAQKIWETVGGEITLKVNKVKAHNGKKDGKRSYVNNLVDKHAKTAMKKGKIK